MRSTRHVVRIAAPHITSRVTRLVMPHRPRSGARHDIGDAASSHVRHACITPPTHAGFGCHKNVERCAWGAFCVAVVKRPADRRGGAQTWRTLGSERVRNSDCTLGPRWVRNCGDPWCAGLRWPALPRHVRAKGMRVGAHHGRITDASQRHHGDITARVTLPGRASRCLHHARSAAHRHGKGAASVRSTDFFAKAQRGGRCEHTLQRIWLQDEERPPLGRRRGSQRNRCIQWDWGTSGSELRTQHPRIVYTACVNPSRRHITPVVRMRHACRRL